LDFAERLQGFPGTSPSPVRYTSPPAVDFPVPPVQIFGVTYDLDIVLRTHHPTWDMHEYARVTTPSGPVWLCKDARRSTLAQSIVADLGPQIAEVIPEVPVERRAGPVEVEDRSTDGWLDVALRYTNLDGEEVAVRYEGPLPRHAQSKRNTSTMGHSRDAVMAVLDLSHRAFARRASITIGGEPQRVERVLGLVPFQLVLAQTQAGFSVGSLTFSQADAASGALESVHDTPFSPGARQTWALAGSPSSVRLVQASAWRTLTYLFGRGGADAEASGGALELREAWVEPWSGGVAAAHVQFEPPLPDVRRRFEGVATGRFVVDVHGQAAHGVGAWEARWTEAGPVVALRPEAPAWFAERPMTARVAFGEGSAEVRIERSP
jgi:hypothetical protein